jgi:integrase/recombinase XerD
VPETLSDEAEALLSSLAAQDRAANTLAAYRRDLASYERYLASQELSVARADGDDVASYVAALDAAGRRPSSVARALVAVRALHRWCGSDAARDVDGPGRTPPAGNVLGEDEVARLLDAYDGDDPVSLRDRAVLETLYATGARISEVVGLATTDVADGVARLGGRSARAVPYGAPAARALDEWLANGRAAMAVGRGPLFVNQRGGPLSRQWGWAITRAAADRVGLGEHFGPHVLRHSFAVHLAARGAPPGALQQLLVGQPVFLGPDELVERYRRWHPRAGPGPVPGTSASH